MNELPLKDESSAFHEPEIETKDDTEGIDGMEVSMEKAESCEKSNEIEEFCKKILKVKGFKNLLDDQNLKDILKDGVINSLLDDLNLRKFMKEKNWGFEFEIEEEVDLEEFDNGNFETTKYENDLPLNKAEIKQEIEDYLEVSLHEINPTEIKQEYNNSDFDIKVPNYFRNSDLTSKEIIDFNGQEIIESEANSEKPVKISDKNKKVRCPLCKKIFKNKYKIAHHISAVHEKLRPFACTHCEGSYKTKGQLKGHFIKFHLQKSENENEILPDFMKSSYPKPCAHCEETFPDHKSFRIHLRTVHPEVRDYKCTDCEKAFRVKENLVLHFKHVHLGVKYAQRPKKPYKLKPRKQCPKCDKSFQNNSLLKDHIDVVHEGKIPYVCPHCGKGFKSGKGLTGHIAIHEGTKKFLCSLCPSSFLTESALKRHVREIHHEGPKAYLCTLCGKSFATGNMLNHHIKRIHEKSLDEVKIRVCNLCQEEFKSRYELNNHKLRVHEGVEPLMCPHCPMGFARSINLGHHLKNVHTSPKFDCSQCDSKFKTQGHLKAHIFSVHTEGEDKWKCPHCPVTLKSKNRKFKHIKEVHPEKLRKLRLTVNYENAERVCPHCNKTFQNKYFMKKHICELHQ